MKKLTLLLAALTVASAAYAKEVMPVAEVEAAPMLKVTSIGQYIEIDNTSGSEDIGEAVMLGNKLGLAYGDDWTFGLMARKGWSMDTDDGISSTNHRIEMSATKHYDNYTVGAIWRAEKDYDRFLATTSYKYDMFSGNLKAGYKFMNNDGVDYIYAEGMPLAVTYNNVKLGYYFEYSK
ncbi:MAG: hypothetical protein Q7K48_02350, partial [Fusobacterium sp. JB021]|nr:hypothetical protein [Fusobacterium sp. JB021]